MSIHLIKSIKVLNLALQLKDATEWSAAIEAADNSQIYPIVDPNTGTVMNMINNRFGLGKSVSEKI